MSPSLIILVIFASVSLLILVGAYIVYRISFYQNPQEANNDLYRYIKDDGKPSSIFSRKLIDDVQKIPFENIYVTSHDGLRLRARLYMKGEDLPFVIEAHGYRSSAMIDFSGGGVLMMELGFNVIMIDERACGESEGRTISFGVNESRDVLAWIEYVRSNFGNDRKIILQGISMGASTVLIASGFKLPECVVGVMADCPYSSGKEIIKKVISKDMRLPAFLFYPLVRLGALIYGRFDPNRADAKEAVKNASVPILLIHGEADDFVPCYMSKKIAEANSYIEIETFPDATHGLSFICDYVRYKSIAERFITKCLYNKTV